MAFTYGFWAADTPGSVDNMNACLLGWGPKGDFPAAAATNKGMLAYATDEYQLYYSSGAVWVALTNGKYTELATAPSVAGGAAWADWDLSATGEPIPAGAKAVVVQCTGAFGWNGARGNGSTMTYVTPAGADGTQTFVVPLDAGRIIEIISSMGLTFYALGYFT